MKISVGLLAYNSERWIAQSAGCLLPYVDEVFVVIDAATTDNTANILREMQIPFAFREWDHNYANAKNALLDNLNGDWIIILDDDEMYSPEAAHRLVELIKTMDSSEIAGIEVPMKQHYPYWVTDEYDYLREFGFNPHVSVFRKGYRFSNKVHEAINVPMDKRLNHEILVKNDLFIHHHAWKGNREKYEGPHHYYYKDLSDGVQFKKGEHTF